MSIGWLRAGALVATAAATFAQGVAMTVHLEGGASVAFATDGIRRLDFQGITAVAEPAGAQAADFRLLAARPNPFNPSTTIDYELAAPAATTVRIVDLRGALVATLQEGPQGAGLHSVVWRGVDDGGRPVASGVYLCALSSGGRTRTAKLVLVK